MRLVLPGDLLATVPKGSTPTIAGVGAVLDDNCIVSTRAAVINSENQGTSSAQLTGGQRNVSARGRSKLYSPSNGDRVVGIITGQQQENYLVDIRSYSLAYLPVQAFEGATKNNRPRLEAGDLVYCRVENAQDQLDVLLTCKNNKGLAEQYGPLEGGLIHQVNCAYALTLSSHPPPVVLTALGVGLKYELAIGMNGRVWILGVKPDVSAIVAYAIEKAEERSEQQVTDMVSKMLSLSR